MGKFKWISEQERIEDEHAGALEEAKRIAMEETPRKVALLEQENMSLMVAIAELYEELQMIKGNV